jgi:hypothetical protein
LRRRMRVLEAERQRRFELRSFAAWRTRFSCCLMFGIGFGVKTPAVAGRRMVASGRRDPHGRELSGMADKRSGGDRRTGEDRRSEEDRRRGEEGPPPDAGERRTGGDRRDGKDRRTGKDRRSGG